MIAPLYCELSEKYPSLMFLTVDVDELTVSKKNLLHTWKVKENIDNESPYNQRPYLLFCASLEESDLRYFVLKKINYSWTDCLSFHVLG